jgi:sec-independent protein translocase protein TatA
MENWGGREDPSAYQSPRLNTTFFISILEWLRMRENLRSLSTTSLPCPPCFDVSDRHSPPYYILSRVFPQEIDMFGLGWTEVGVIAIVALLVFGPKKIPELGSALGKTLRGFKEELNKTTSDEDSTPEEEEK